MNLKTIIYRSHPDIISVHALRKSKERVEQQRFIAEGIRACTTLLESNSKLEQLYATEQMLSQIPDHIKSDQITLVTQPVMEKISQATTPSGLLGVFQIPQTQPDDTLTPGIVLARIADPGNMGTLIRSCAAMNIKNVITIEGADPWSFKTVQSSAGYIGNVTISSMQWEELLNKKKDSKLCALVVKEDKKPQEIDLQNTLLVVGSEAHGIPEAWLKSCEATFSLPMPGKVESLNAAVAGSIALYLLYK